MTKKIKKKTQSNPWLSNLVLGLIFVVGLLVVLYPKISDLYYRLESESVNQYFDDAKGDLSKEELDRRLSLAESYNRSLRNDVSHDPYLDGNELAGRKEYARMLEIKEYMGHVEIPKIDQDIPMFAGTTEAVLQKGIGHLEGTSLPIGGESTHAVLTAHTGLPKMRLFTDLKKMEIGDRFYVHNIADILAYEVDQILVVEPSNFNDLLIEPGKDYVTLLTCTPYMVNTHRLLVRGHRIDYVKEVKEAEVVSQSPSYLMWVVLLLLLILVGIIFLYFRRKRKKHYEK